MKNYSNLENRIRQIWRKTLFFVLSSLFIIFNLGLMSTPLNAYASSDTGIKIEGFNDYVDVGQCNYSLTGTPGKDTNVNANVGGQNKTFSCITLQHQLIEGNDFSYVYSNENLNEFDYYVWQEDDPITSGLHYAYYDNNPLSIGEYNGKQVFDLTDKKFLSSFKNYMVYKVMKFVPEWSETVDGKQKFTFANNDKGEIFYDTNSQYTSYYRYNAKGELEIVYNKYAELGSGKVEYLPTNRYEFGNSKTDNYNYQYNTITNLHNSGFKLQEYSQTYSTVDFNGNKVGSPNFDSSSYVRNDSGIINFYIWDAKAERFYIYNVNVVEDNNWVSKGDLESIFENGNQTIIQRLENELIAKTKEYRSFYESTYKLVETVKKETGREKFEITEEKYIPSQTTDDTYVSFDVKANALNYDMYYEYEFEELSETMYDYTINYRQQQYEYNIIDKEKIDGYESLESYALKADGDSYENNIGPQNGGTLLSGISTLARQSNTRYYTKLNLGKWDWKFSINATEWGNKSGASNFFSKSSSGSNGTILLTNQNRQPITFNGASKVVTLGGATRTIYHSNDGWYYANGNTLSGRLHKMSGYEIAVSHSSEWTPYSTNENQYSTSSGIGYDTIKNSSNGQTHTYYTDKQRIEKTRTVYDVKYKYAEKTGSGTSYTWYNKAGDGKTYDSGIKDVAENNEFRVYTKQTAGNRRLGVYYEPFVRKYVSWSDNWSWNNDFYYYIQLCNSNGTCSNNYYLIKHESKHDPTGFPSFSFSDLSNPTHSPAGKHGEYTDGTNGVKTSSIFNVTADKNTSFSSKNGWWHGFKENNLWEETKSGAGENTTEKFTYVYDPDVQYKNDYDTYTVKSDSISRSETEYTKGSYYTISGRRAYITECSPREIHDHYEYRWLKNILTVSRKNIGLSHTGNFDIKNNGNFDLYNSSNNYVSAYTETNLINYLKGPHNSKGTYRGNNYHLEYATNGSNTVSGTYNIYVYDYSFDNINIYQYQKVEEKSVSKSENYSKLSPTEIKNRIESSYSNVVESVTCSGTTCSVKTKGHVTDATISLNIMGNEWARYQNYITYVKSSSLDKPKTNGSWTGISSVRKGLYNTRVSNLIQNETGPTMQNDSGFKKVGDSGSGVNLVTSYKRTYNKRYTHTEFTFSSFKDTNNITSLHYLTSDPNYSSYTFTGKLNSIDGAETTLTKCSSSSNGICYREESMSKVVSTQTKTTKYVNKTYVQTQNADYSKTSGNIAYYASNLPSGRRLCKDGFDNNCVVLKSVKAKATHSTHEYTKTTRTYKKQLIENNTAINYGSKTNNSNTNNYYELGTLKGAEFVNTGNFTGGTVVGRIGSNMITSHNRFDQSSWFLMAPSGINKYMNGTSFVFEGTGRTSTFNLSDLVVGNTYYFGMNAKGSGVVKVTVNGVSKTFSLSGTDTTYKMTFTANSTNSSIIFEFSNAKAEMYNIYVSNKDAFTEYATYSKGNVTNIFYEANSYQTSAKWYDAVEGHNKNNPLTTTSRVIGYDNKYFTNGTLEENEREAVNYIIDLIHKKQFNIAKVVYFIDLNNDSKVDVNKELYKQDNYVNKCLDDNCITFRYVLNGKDGANLTYETERKVTINFSNNTIFGTRVNNVISDGNNTNGYYVSRDFISGKTIINWNDNINSSLPYEEMACLDGKCYSINSLQGKYILAKEFMTSLTTGEIAKYGVNEYGVVVRKSDNDLTNYARYVVERDVHKKVGSDGIVYRLDSGFREHLMVEDKGINYENYKDIVLASGLKLGDNTDIESSIIGVNSSNYTINQETLKYIYENNSNQSDFNISKKDIKLENGKYILTKAPRISFENTRSKAFDGDTHLGLAISNDTLGSYEEYFSYNGEYYRIIKDDKNTTGFTRYKEYYINGKWNKYNLLTDENNVLTSTDLNISDDFAEIGSFRDFNIYTYLYETGTNEYNYLIENIVLNVYENQNGIVKDKYTIDENDRYFYRYEVDGNTSKHNLIKTYRLYELQDIFNKENSIEGTSIKVNTNILDVNGILFDVKEKFIFRNQSYNVYNIKTRTDDLFVKNVLKLSDLKGDNGEFLDYSNVNMETVENNRTYGLKFSGMLNYWGNTIINGTNIRKQSDKTILDATEIKQKDSSIKIGEEIIPEFILNGTGKNNFELYGLDQVLDNDVYYNVEDIINNALHVLSRYVSRNDAGNAKYLMQNDNYTSISNSDYITSDLIDWNSVASTYNGFYEMFKNSSLFNVAYYVDDSIAEVRHYVGQYKVNNMDNEFTKAIIDNFGFLMEYYMMNTETQNMIDFESLFADNSKEELQIFNASYSHKIESPVKQEIPGYKCNQIQAGQFKGQYSCTLVTKIDKVYEDYKKFTNETLSDDEKTANEQLKKLLLYKDQNIGYVFDPYLYLNEYGTKVIAKSNNTRETRAITFNNLKIQGFVNLLDAIVNSNTNEYIFVASETTANRYFIYKKLTNPDIIRNVDNNYNQMYYSVGTSNVSLGQYMLNFNVSSNEELYKDFINSSKNDFKKDLFKYNSLENYFNINGKQKTINVTKKDTNEGIQNKRIKVDNSFFTNGRPKYEVNLFNDQSFFDWSEKEQKFIPSELKDCPNPNGMYLYPYGNFVEDIIMYTIARGNYIKREQSATLNKDVFDDIFQRANLPTIDTSRMSISILETIANVNGKEISIPLSQVASLDYDISSNEFIVKTKGIFDEFEMKTNINFVDTFVIKDYVYSNIKFQNRNHKDIKTVTLSLNNTIGSKNVTKEHINDGSFTVIKNIENDTDYTNIRTNFNIKIKPNENKIYNYTLSYASNTNACAEGFTYSAGKCYYQGPGLTAKDFYGSVYNITGTEAIIPNLAQKTEFTLSIGLRNADGTYIEKYKETFTTGNDMVRNPYGNTLGKTNVKNGVYAENSVINADELLKTEYIPYDLKEWLFEKQVNTLPETMRKTITGETYEISSKYLSKLSKNNTIKIGFALIDNENNVFKPKLSDFTVRFVEGIEKGQNDKYHKNKNGNIDIVMGRDGVFYFELNNEELLLFKNKYKEDYIKFVDDYIFKNYIIEVDYSSGKYGNMSLQTPYKMMAMSCHDEMWSYLDYNQNGSMDKSLDASDQYYDRNGEIVFSEDVSDNIADVTVGLDFGIDKIDTMWHQSKIANVKEFKMFRFYTGTAYKYYIMGYNRNNNSNIIK